MHRKPAFPAFAAAFAALVAGCEWTGTSSSDSWSGSYDAMNFSGTYRAAATLSSGSSSSEGTTVSVRETVGSYSAGTYRYSGQLSHTPVDLATVQIQLGGLTYTSDGSGNLVSDYGAGKVTTSGAWSVDVTADSTSTSSETTGGHQMTVSGEALGKNSTAQSFNGKLKRTPIVPNSVQIVLSNGVILNDNGNQSLLSSSSGFGGTVQYESGTVSIDWQGAQQYDQWTGSFTATYNYYDNKTTTSTTSTSSPLKGSGSIVAVYSYTSGNSSSVITSSSDMTAITVSQSGQNLSLTTNTGIQMSGRFTAVRQTSSEDAATPTYNAQFQVSSASGHKLVGSLNYDLSTSRRTLNGTLTQGKATYDVQGVGPSF